MLDIARQVLGHNDLGIHAIGWLLSILGLAFTLLWKGLWARIKQIGVQAEENRRDLDQLIGAHNAIAHKCGHDIPIIEIRSDPNRVTIPGYTPLESEEL